MNCTGSCCHKCNVIIAWLIIRGPWRYGAHEGCSEFGLGCYFQSHDQCAHALHMGAAADPLEGEDTLKEQRVGTWHAPNWQEVEPRADGYVPKSLGLPEHHGVLWWRAHLAMWLMQPKPALALRLGRLKSELGWLGPIIGVHVRRGDACFHAATSNYRPPCAQWEEYAQAALRMAQLYGGVHTVYLSTDDMSVVDQALADKRFRLLHISFDRQVFDNNWFIEYRMAEGAVDTKMVSESAVLDAMLLGDCDYLVGRWLFILARALLCLMLASSAVSQATSRALLLN